MFDERILLLPSLRISQETVDELSAINRRKRDINRQIRKLQSDLDSTRNTLELKVFSDQIMDQIVSLAFLFTLTLSTDGYKQMKNIFVNLRQFSL